MVIFLAKKINLTIYAISYEFRVFKLRVRNRKSAQNRI